MFFFPANGSPVSLTNDKINLLGENIYSMWETSQDFEDFDILSGSFQSYLSLKSEPAFKVDFIASFAFLTDFFISCVLIAFLLTHSILELLQNSVKDLIKVFQNHLFVLFIEQASIKDKIKGIFVPLKMLLDSLRPIKIAA